MEKQKNIPVLRFPEFDGEWVKKKIKDFAPLQRGFDLPVDRIVEGKYPVVFSNGILKFHNEYKVKAPGVVTGRSGTIGKVTYVESDFWAHNTSLWVTDFKQNHPKFVYFFYSRYNLEKFATGSGVPTLNRNDIHEQTEHFPETKEQLKIASFFTAIDQKISQLKKKHQLLEQYKKGVMQKIFSQQIRFKDDDGREFPKWEKKKLGSFLIERNTQAPKSDEYPLMAFVANKGVAHKGERYNREFLVNDESNKKYKQTEYGDFIYSSNNLETGSIGLNCFGSASISPVYSIFQIRESCNSQFISRFLVRKSFINKMTNYRQGVVYGQWRIHESDFLKIEERIPSIEEQTKIANFLSAIDDKIHHTQKQIEQAEQWKKGLMQKMFV